MSVENEALVHLGRTYEWLWKRVSDFMTVRREAIRPAIVAVLVLRTFGQSDRDVHVSDAHRSGNGRWHLQTRSQNRSSRTHRRPSCANAAVAGPPSSL
jgi:hypothetical protein